MNGHPENCYCEYCRTLRKIQMFRNAYGGAQGQYQYMDEEPWQPNTHHRATAEDPFPPGGTRTGRFKVHHPPYTQQRREARHPGKYQRIYNNAMDMFEWQYKPWPTAEWVTYYKVSAEMLAREVRTIGVKLTSKKFHTAASRALSEERFYKVERVDSSA